MAPWVEGGSGVLRLPSGLLVRGRSLRRPLPPGPLPQLTLCLSGRPPEPGSWEVGWIRWPDFRLPSEREAARRSLLDAYRRCAEERVEVACAGGRGRTGTALACLAVLDGLPADEAVALVRRHYDRRAVETLPQRRYVAAFVPWSS
ncbi:MAG TPA: protein-tyrosine phosphatase family protein [Propionibacteriaceae bacterium]